MLFNFFLSETDNFTISSSLKTQKQSPWVERTLWLLVVPLYSNLIVEHCQIQYNSSKQFFQIYPSEKNNLGSTDPEGDSQPTVGLARQIQFNLIELFQGLMEKKQQERVKIRRLWYFKF